MSGKEAGANVDLSHPIETGMQTYPGDPDVAVRSHAAHDADGYRVSSLELGSHTGTHVDAPSHVLPDGKTLDAYPLDRFVFDAVRVDCRDLGPREPVPPERIPSADADCVVLWTGWDTHWGTERYLDHPYLSPVAARACVDRGLAVASDTLNPDPTPTDAAGDDEPDGLVAHHALLEADCLILENLTGLDAVADRFELRAYPLATRGDGAPVRAVGVV
ncbi:cyclase family protein [Halobellus ruber]|uniref:Cyclase family protein n=1 Tax=Halobellus ruber TaxID=2761102 RepID=A0A7J9SFW9_9EURY|nr:cyclase family protein [Halobellus ruber]MBB6645273.1 cyclase family protein [Halobellus ruber]